MDTRKTTIVECARSQSEEAQNNNDSNPAQWTNRVGTGLKLKAGDQISVHSSFVSENRSTSRRDTD